MTVTGAAACGKKGPPLAPLRLVPSAAGEPAARRTTTEVELHFGVPAVNANGPGPVDLARVEIYAVTVAPGAIMPPNREFLAAGNVVGTIAVKPPSVEGEDTSSDKRPGPGDRITFVEELTDAKLKPTPGVGTRMPVPAKGAATVPGSDPSAAPSTAADATSQKPEQPEPTAAGQKPESTPKPAGETVAAGTAAQKPEPATPPIAPPVGGALPTVSAMPTPAAQPAKPVEIPVVPGLPTATVAPATVPTRIYAIRGISRAGRPGLPSTRLAIPLIEPPPSPAPVVVRMVVEGVLNIEWMPPVAEFGSLPLLFNVYRAGSLSTPMNQGAINGVLFQMRVGEYGKEQCFAVRTVQTSGAVAVEGDPTPPACLTPADTFPPVQPRGLRAVAEEGAINLVWEANTEPDLAGYLVLRGDASGGTLQPITAQPLKDASYRDTAIKPGVRYMYAVVAVDNATPRNTSAQSAPEAVTSR
jgi:hypothetical protein